jgi:hypothetical protein
MKLLFSLILLGLLVSHRSEAQARDPVARSASQQGVETIVCVRHGEKPHAGLGQLTCRGLNRSLALPNVLLSKFGTPEYIFAPNPTQKVDEGHYYYIRPLATIEPTAIRCGLPVNTEYGFMEIDGLAHELDSAKYRSATVFVAWEHVLLDMLAKKMVKENGGSSSQVPSWPGDDYDTIFVIKITHASGGNTVTFTIDHEGLNNLSDNCP